MSTGALPMDPPPPYTKLPTHFTPIDGQAPPLYTVTDAKTEKQDIEVDVFLTKWRLQSGEVKKFEPNGTLLVGTKVVTNLLDHAVFFRPFNDDKDTKRHDISHTITVEKINDDTIRYHKALHSTSPYSFQVDISAFATEEAKFKGTLTKGTEIYDWLGEWSSKSTLHIEATVDAIEKPAWVSSGSIDQLDKLTPIARVGEGTGDDALKAGQDAAQYYGDRILHKIMMHSLEDTSGNDLVGKQQPLDQGEIEILTANKDFFQRGAVHTLCEQIKTMKGMEPKIADHIKWKYNFYLKMLASPSAPKAGQWDPVGLYGLKRDTDATLLAKLQSQYQNATMSCYELGYRRQCSEWEHYLQAPDYWFKVYQQRLLSDEFIKKWTTTSINPATGLSGQVSGEEQVRIWSNKLSLLKHAAQAQGKDKPEFSVEHISNALLGRLHQEAAYFQLLNDNLVKESSRLFEQMDKAPLTDAFKQTMEKMDGTAKDAAAELQSALPHVFALLANSRYDVHTQIREYWDARMPGGAPKDLTVGQMIEGIEMVPLKEVAAVGDTAPQLVGEGEAVTQINKKGGGWLNKIGKFVGKSFKVLFKVALHAGAVFFLYSFFAGDKSHASVSEMGTVICAAVTEGVAILGKGIGKLLSFGKAMNWAMAEKGAYRTATAWFAGTMKAGKTFGARVIQSLVGDLAKVIRVLGQFYQGSYHGCSADRSPGLIGCIFNLVTSYWGMNAAGDPNDPNVKNERYFSKWYFALGVVEGVAIVGGIAAEILGFTALGAVCGPLALIVGAIAIGVLLVQLIWFPPDPWAAIRTFLGGLPKDFGSYDENSEEKNPWLTTLKRDDITFTAVFKKLPEEGDHQPGTEIMPDHPPHPRLITVRQDNAARDVEGWINMYIADLEMLSPNAPFIEPLAAFGQVLGMIRMGVEWLPAMRAFNAAIGTLSAAWPASIQAAVGHAQYPTFMNAHLREMGIQLIRYLDALFDALRQDI